MLPYSVPHNATDHEYIWRQGRRANCPVCEIPTVPFPARMIPKFKPWNSTVYLGFIKHKETLNRMKALTLTQPWATLIACGAKRIETRSWSTTYRGVIAIHAAKGLTSIGGKRGFQELCATRPFERALSKWLEDCGAMKSPLAAAWAIPFGAIVATANLVECLSTNSHHSLFEKVGYQKPSVHSDEYAFGCYDPDRFMWFLEGVKPLRQPIECRGALSLWNVPKEAEERINATMASTYQHAEGGTT